MPIRTLDHFLITVRDLGDAAETYRRLGFHVRPAAKHLEIGSANCVIHLAATYLELFHFADAAAWITDQYQSRLDVGEGLAHVSLGSRDLEADRARLAGEGLNPGPILNARRRIVQPDGSPDETASSSFYVWRDLHRYMSLFHSFHGKPDAIFIKAYEDHPNTVGDVVRLVYMSRDPAADIRYFSTLFCGAPATVDAEGFTFVGPRGEVTEVLTVPAATARYGRHLSGTGLGALGGLPVALHYSVRSVDACSRHLSAHRIAQESFDGNLVVPADQACGVTSVFEPSA